MIGARGFRPQAPHAVGRAGLRALLAAASLATLRAARPAWCAWQSFGLREGLADLKVHAVAQDRSEALWFGTDHGATRYDGAFFRTFSEDQGLVQEKVQARLNGSKFPRISL